MAYDKAQAERIRRMLSGREDLTEREMFGGISFMIGGKMCVGMIKDDLIVRVGPEGYEEAISQPHARDMDFTGRSLKGFVYVGPEGFDSEETLAKWVNQAVDFVSGLMEDKS